MRTPRGFQHTGIRVAICSLILLSALIGCGEEKPKDEPGKPLPPPLPPPVKKIVPDKLTGILLPRSARYQRFIEVKPDEDGKGALLLARFDLPTGDLEKIGEGNPHLPAVTELKENAELLATMSDLKTDARWWQPGLLKTPRCAKAINQRIPVRVKPEKEEPEKEKPEKEEPEKATKPETEAPKPDNRVWTVTLCVGDIDREHVRAYVLFEEKIRLPGEEGIDTITGATEKE